MCMDYRFPSVHQFQFSSRLPSSITRRSLQGGDRSLERVGGAFAAARHVHRRNILWEIIQDLNIP
jgi:hypothetical protein